MSLRRKLLLSFSLAVFFSIGAVTGFVLSATRKSFDQSNDEQTAALVAQFRREFDRRGEDIARRVEAAGASEIATRIALTAGHGTPDFSLFVHDARTLADNQQLDFLEIVDSQGTILSSAQAPARFGYKDPSLPSKSDSEPFLRQEDLPEGSALALEVVGTINASEKQLMIIGGQRLDAAFLASLDAPAGTKATLYQNSGASFSPGLLLRGPSISAPSSELAGLIETVRMSHHDASASIQAAHGQPELWHAIPLPGADGSIPAILLVGSSRQHYFELRRHITSVAVVAGSAGIFLAILLSTVIAARITKPIEQLQSAAQQVASGNWHTQVAVTSSDELGTLAESFNQMTSELLSQRDRLIQAERVAAWRELARRLAHELKNPLFPLQLTVENLLRAKQRSPQDFEEVFAESSATLLAEISNLKNIISRFGEFSKMPQPHFQPVDVNELVTNAARLFQAQFSATNGIHCKMNLDGNAGHIEADHELLHRALSNLILNAIDAMPSGGTLKLTTHRHGDGARIEVCDTGKGITHEECDRLFTPYYTSKTQGTGLGLAIVQSIVSDHQGKISVRSEPGEGSTFTIDLPANSEKLQQAKQEHA